MTVENTPDYGWQNAKSPHTHVYLSEPIRRILISEGIESLIDLGCGNGNLCAKLKSNSISIVGLEPSKSGYEIATQAHPQIQFYHLGVQDSPSTILQNHAPFQAAVSTEVIEHLYTPSDLPNFARQILKANGLLIITTPYHGYLKNLLLSIFNKWDDHHGPLWDGGHIKFWSRATLSKLLENNGFEVVSFSGLGRFPWVWKSMMLVARRKN